MAVRSVHGGHRQSGPPLERRPGRPNTGQSQFMPLGNGTLGLPSGRPVGSPRSSTATTPSRTASRPARSCIPGLSRLTSAADFSGYLDLYDGTLRESGGGMTADRYMRADKRRTGRRRHRRGPDSHPDGAGEAVEGRNPSAQASGSVGHARRDLGGQHPARGVRATFGSLARSAPAAGTSAPRRRTPDRSGQLPPQQRRHRSGSIAAAPHWTGGNADKPPPPPCSAAT